MKTAWLNLRSDIPSRTLAFRSGLAKNGYSVSFGAPLQPNDGDLLLTWNRIGVGNVSAQAFEAKGLTVLVTENSTWGNGFLGESWLFFNRNLHNTRDLSPIGGNERWDSLGVELKKWREGEGETVILAQRGIGSAPVAMPKTWPHQALARWGGRIRAHPGNHPHPIPLENDLAKASRVVTWSSGSAIAALMWGIPVHSEAPNWVGEQDNSYAGRLNMFRRLAWNQWRLSEIESGEAVAWMLEGDNGR